MPATDTDRQVYSRFHFANRKDPFSIYAEVQIVMGFLAEITEPTKKITADINEKGKNKIGKKVLVQKVCTFTTPCPFRTVNVVTITGVNLSISPLFVFRIYIPKNPSHRPTEKEKIN